MHRMLIVVVLVLLFSACASPMPVSHPAAISGSLNIQLDIQIPDVERAHVRLRPIPGGIYGNPVSENVAEAWVGDGRTFTLDVASMERRAWPMAKPAGKGMGIVAPEIDPPDTRFCRIGTAQTVRRGGHTLGNRGSFDSEDGTGYIMVYVDRAARMTGDFSTSGEFITSADLEFPGPGFYWIRYDYNADKSAASLTVLEGNMDGMKFVIEPR